MDEVFIRQNITLFVTQQMTSIFDKMKSKVRSRVGQIMLKVFYFLLISWTTYNLPKHLFRYDIFPPIEWKSLMIGLTQFRLKFYAKRSIHFVLMDDDVRNQFRTDAEYPGNDQLIFAIEYSFDQLMKSSKNANIVLHPKDHVNRLVNFNDFMGHNHYKSIENYYTRHIAPYDTYIHLDNGIIFHKHLYEKSEDKHDKDGKVFTGIVRRVLIVTLYGKCANDIEKYLEKSVEIYRDNVLKIQHEKHQEEMHKDLTFYDLQGRIEINGKNQCVFERFRKISISKTFDSIFFPEKKKLLQMLDHFVKKDGRYKISGYPQKLGFLLHGPPGTGKTSFIKALANYMHRDIMNISLPHIRTNKELVEILVKGKFTYSVWGDTHSAELLALDRCIFVLEDIDCMNVVKSREITHQDNKIQETITEMELLGLYNSISLLSSANESDSGQNHRTQAMNKFIESYESLKSELNDTLNLGCILNILDGIVECKDRVIIMTTNHMDYLDPALFRPGRIDEVLLLTYIKAPECIQMIEHYFPIRTLNLDEKKIITDYLDVHQSVTPAEIEHLCVKYESVEELLESFI
jgi:hypothetical protein